MRFRFCGGLEPPDWLLAEIPLLATLDIYRVTATCRILSQASDDAQAAESLRDAYTNAQDAMAVTSVLRFVLFQAAKYDVADRELATELLQLGVAGQTAQAIAAVYDSDRASMRKHLESRSFKFPAIEQLRWRVHVQGAETSSKTARVEMRLQLDGEVLPCENLPGVGPKGDSLVVTMTDHKFLALYEELSQAQAILQTLSR